MICVLNTDQPLKQGADMEMAVRLPACFHFRSHVKLLQETSKSQSTYGTFQDVSVEHPFFDLIETAVISGYMEYLNPRRRALVFAGGNRSRAKSSPNSLLCR